MNQPPLVPSRFADRVAAATGLAGMLATGAIRRCCKRANVDIRSLTPKDLPGLLPHIEAILVLYLPEEQTRASLARLRELAGGEVAPRTEHSTKTGDF